MKRKKLIYWMGISLLVLSMGLTGCSAEEEKTDATVPKRENSIESVAQPDRLLEEKVLGLSFEAEVLDNSGNGLETILNKEGTFVEGVAGQALYFDGATYIDLGNSGMLQPAQLSFATWIRVDEVLAGEHMIAWFKPSGDYKGEGWYLSCLDDNTPLKLSVGKSAGQPMEIFISGSRQEFFPKGEWVHIAVTYDSDTHKAAIYRNGVAQNVQYINVESEIHEDESSHKYIGFNSPGYNGGFAKMSLDELAIYSRILETTEVVKLYTQYGAEFDGSEIVVNDYEALNMSVKSVKKDIVLPVNGGSGSTISWKSSDESVLSKDGKVTRPVAGEEDALVTLTAQIAYGDYVKEKSFELCVEAMPAFEDLEDFTLGDVELLDTYETNAFTLEVDYLKSLDADRMLKGFCDIAGVESDATLYGGWESSAIKGHTLGHYLSALSQAYGSNNDAELLNIMNHVVEVLAQCQNAETGYLAAIPESHYLQIEKGNTAGTWVPWYTMHKVLAGLLDVYEETGNEQALEVASKLGDWVYSRTSKWNAATQTTVLNVEYGGMNDCLYQLYSHTNKQEHLQAAHSFDEMNLFEALYKGEDVLNGKHANTTIPKIVGAWNRYRVLGEGEEYYLQVAENFWEIVVNNHTYITGGNSEWEHFGEANILDAERTNCNCETCNTYNMLKLSRELFKITGNRKYADYYENTFVNAILSSQNPETGMTTYFQPMASGYFKVYSSATGHFWCCTGSGMENFSKLGDSIYYKEADSVYVTRYTSSTLTWEEKNLVLKQETDIPYTDKVKLTVATLDGAETAVDIVLRVPDWCMGDVTVKVNGTEASIEVVNGFIRLDGSWQNGDVIEYTIPLGTVVYDLPDSEEVVAFKYGPLVLSADLGTEDMATGTTGVNVTVPTMFVEINDVITVTEGTRAEWLADIADNLVRKEGTLEFTLQGTDRDIVFTPHYLQYQNRYGIYFKLIDSTMVVESDEKDLYDVIDSLPVANDQYEFSHNLDADLSATGTHKNLNYRDASPDGYFSYDMAVEDGVTNYLKVKYFSGDAGRSFVIKIDGAVLEEVVLENVNPGDFYEAYYEIPAEMINDKESITVIFEASLGSYAGGIFDRLSIVKLKE